MVIESICHVIEDDGRRRDELWTDRELSDFEPAGVKDRQKRHISRKVGDFGHACWKPMKSSWTQQHLLETSPAIITSLTSTGEGYQKCEVENCCLINFF